jgi:hypothetical protein
MIDIVINEPLIGHVNEYDAVIVGTNCYQVMRNGFQNEVAENYPYVREVNYGTKYGDINKLGEIIECKKEGCQTFILAFLTFGYNFKGSNMDFFDYDALVKCIKLINILYSGKRLATTMVGCTEYDGNADKNKVLRILNEYVTDFDLTIYDYRQESHKIMKLKEYITKRKKENAKRKK